MTTKKVSEMSIDPNTGAYVDGPEDMTTDWDIDVQGVAATSDYPTEIEIADTTSVEPVVEPVCDPASDQAKSVNVYLRDIVMANDNEYEIDFDISLAVEARDAGTGAVLDAGVVVKRLRIRKDAIAKELMNRTMKTPVTESLASIPQKETIKESAKEDTLKRLRELAGIPSKGNWV